MKTYSPKAKDIQRAWHVVDADGAVLGRLASEVAHVLRGKHKPTFAPHMDSGDHVIVVNASKIRVTGAKASDKVYYHHSQYPGGLSEIPYERMAERRPERIVERAIRGMLPHNRLGRQMLRKLAVYAGPEHPHAAQTPAPLELKGLRRDRGESASGTAAAKPAAAEQAPVETASVETAPAEPAAQEKDS